MAITSREENAINALIKCKHRLDYYKHIVKMLSNVRAELGDRVCIVKTNPNGNREVCDLTENDMFEEGDEVIVALINAVSNGAMREYGRYGALCTELSIATASARSEGRE